MKELVQMPMHMLINSPFLQIKSISIWPHLNHHETAVKKKSRKPHSTVIICFHSVSFNNFPSPNAVQAVRFTFAVLGSLTIFLLASQPSILINELLDTVRATRPRTCANDIKVTMTEQINKNFNTKLQHWSAA